MIQWIGWIGAASGKDLPLISLTTPPVFGFATNKKLISLQSPGKLIRSAAVRVDGMEAHTFPDKWALFDSDVKLMTIKRWWLLPDNMETVGR